MKCPIRVIVRTCEGDQTVHDRIGDHASPKFRKWISKTAHWAVRNDHYVMTGPHNG